MYDAKEIASYFLLLDKNGELFNTRDLMDANGRRFWAGNARLNKYLHLAQNIYYAKNGRRLFRDDLYAYDNGAVVPSVLERYPMLVAKRKSAETNISAEDAEFLDKLYMILEGATVQELIGLSHEDAAWEDRHMYYRKEDQLMDTDSHLDEYKIQYDDVIRLMDRIHA